MAYPMMRRTYNTGRRLVYRYVPFMTPSGIKNMHGGMMDIMKAMIPGSKKAHGHGNGMVHRMTARAKNMIPTMETQAYADIPEPGTNGISFKGTAGIGGKSQ